MSVSELPKRHASRPEVASPEWVSDLALAICDYGRAMWECGKANRVESKDAEVAYDRLLDHIEEVTREIALLEGRSR